MAAGAQGPTDPPRGPGPRTLGPGSHGFAQENSRVKKSWLELWLDMQPAFWLGSGLGSRLESWLGCPDMSFKIVKGIGLVLWCPVSSAYCWFGALVWGVQRLLLVWCSGVRRPAPIVGLVLRCLVSSAYC